MTGFNGAVHRVLQVHRVLKVVLQVHRVLQVVLQVHRVLQVCRPPDFFLQKSQSHDHQKLAKILGDLSKSKLCNSPDLKLPKCGYVNAFDDKSGDYLLQVHRVDCPIL